MDKPALITLTFDDGLRCQFQQAVPILNQYGFPATFFLVANAGPIHTDGYAERIGFKWPKIAWNADDIRFLKAMVEREKLILQQKSAFTFSQYKGCLRNSSESSNARLKAA